LLLTHVCRIASEHHPEGQHQAYQDEIDNADGYSTGTYVSDATEPLPADYDQDNDDEGVEEDRTPTPTPESMRGDAAFDSNAAGYGTGQQDSSYEEDDAAYSAGQPDMQSHSGAGSYAAYPANTFDASVYAQGPSIGYHPVAPAYHTQTGYGGGYGNQDHPIYFQAHTSGLFSTGDLNPDDTLDGRKDYTSAVS
jgi:hypothetical protein